jgi:hypothetical protein
MGVTKGVSTPGVREEATQCSVPSNQFEQAAEYPEDFLEALKQDILKAEEPDSPLLEKAEASVFRGMVARANYLALDRPDIQFSVKEIARRMAKPRMIDWQLLKRLARYLVTAPRCVCHFSWQYPQDVVDIFVDADWAGCKKTSRSTSGGAVMMGWHTIKTFSSTQATIALSSGESELYALTKGASQALGFIALARDLGSTIQATVHTDASAILGIVNRQGLGKLRHVKVQYLWLQEKVRDKSLAVRKVPGPDNPADLMTKYLPVRDIEKHLQRLSVECRDNRADTAPMLSTFQRRGTDSWHEGDGEIVREHAKPRRDLFTPTRVDGEPPARALSATRVTVGTFMDDGKEFKVVDEWRNRKTAHRDMGRWWIGTTAS